VSIQYPGDALIPNPAMVFDRTREIAAAPERVWPWLAQLGKQRAGWYLPFSIERWLPRSRRATRSIVAKWQGLTVGDRISDYGGRHEYLEVVTIDAPNSLVYRAERFGTVFTWALLLTPTPNGATCVHLRFRGLLRSTGSVRAAIVFAGDCLDRATTVPMLEGLAERVSLHEHRP
jgi:Polyketide cyclase / dehydrase and lipid transport